MKIKHVFKCATNTTILITCKANKIQLIDGIFFVIRLAQICLFSALKIIKVLVLNFFMDVMTFVKL